MRDRDVRLRLVDRLQEQYPSEQALVINELGIREGRARADVALVNGYVHGFEIKSSRDSLSRLPDQVQFYNQVFDRCSAVVSTTHLDDARELLPEWWGLVQAHGEGSVQELEELREPGTNPNQDARALVELLWRQEALNALEERDLDRGLRSKPRTELWDALAESLKTAELSSLVSRTLRSRSDWPPGQT